MNTPWKLSIVESRYTLAYVENADGEQVANCNSPALADSVCESNAALIVRAVNSHQALVDALEWYVKNDDASGEDGYYMAGQDAAYAALKLARGES